MLNFKQSLISTVNRSSHCMQASVSGFLKHNLFDNNDQTINELIPKKSLTNSQRRYQIQNTINQIIQEVASKKNITSQALTNTRHVNHQVLDYLNGSQHPKEDSCQQSSSCFPSTWRNDHEIPVSILMEKTYTNASHRASISSHHQKKNLPLNQNNSILGQLYQNQYKNYKNLLNEQIHQNYELIKKYQNLQQESYRIKLYKQQLSKKQLQNKRLKNRIRNLSTTSYPYSLLEEYQQLKLQNIRLRNSNKFSKKCL